VAFEPEKTMSREPAPPNSSEEEPAAGDSPLAPACSGGELRRFRSEDLLQGAREVFIQHGDELYRLRLTRQGKLILYK
jgi:hemin uptake protein HemP